LRSDLGQANVRLSVGEFLILQTSAATLSGALSYFISRATPVAVLFALGGWFVPMVWLRQRKAARLKAFNEQLADTIELIATHSARD
jgi:Flp pilus assembly protein TadB